MVGHENFATEFNYLRGEKSGETFPNVITLSNFNRTGSLGNIVEDYRTEGYFSRVKYNYNNKYFVEGSLRRDGSSRFHEDTRWGNFWSFGGGWVISAEDFFKVKQIEYLKLRASYGEVGEDGSAGLYAYHSLYRIEQNDGQTALLKYQIGNEKLKWETSSSINLGLDVRVFDRMNFTLEYFNKRSQNLLFELNMPLSNGANTTTIEQVTMTSNVGTISNRGIEASFDIDIVNNKDWKWNFGMNATWLKNKLVRLPEENRANGISLWGYPFLRKEGKSIYEFYMPHYVGVDQMTGRALYSVDDEKYNVNGSAPDKSLVPEEYLVSINGKYYTTLPETFGKKEYAGSSLPKVDGGISTTLSYKGISFSVLCSYGIGGKVLDTDYYELMSVETAPKALHKDILNAWTGIPNGMTETSPNRINPNGVPVVNFANSRNDYVKSDRFLQKRDYFAIKNISVNYDFPKGFLSKLKISQLSLNFGVENVALFTHLKGMDPQQSFSGAYSGSRGASRTFILGLNVGF